MSSSSASEGACGSAPIDDLAPSGAVEVGTLDGSGSQIALEGVGLRFRVFTGEHSNLKTAAIAKVTGSRRAGRSEGRWLYRGLDLRIGHGARLGIIGRNGSGKSTLLKMICGIYPPTEGTIRVRGRVSPLIEMGAGMLPELTGEENIVLNGTLLGYTRREMKKRIDEIIAFAGLEDARSMPFKYYSSGMKMRLSFAAATDLRPEILVVDEVFSGGDADFVARATERMNTLLDASSIVLFVSHRLPLVRELCDKIIWIDNGTIRAFGDPKPVIHRYHAAVNPEWLERQKTLVK